MIMESFKYKDDIEPYIKIMKSYKEGKLDYQFSAIFKQYYRLNAARLSDSFYNEYFEILKSNNCDNVYEITEKLERIGCNSLNARKVHFSFATKLRHTVDDNSPIYDSMIAAFYFFPAIKIEWSKEQKIDAYKISYEFLKYEYDRLIKKCLLNDVLEKFNNKICNADKISTIKKIDFIIWKYVNLSKSGKIRNKEIEFG